MSPLLFLVLFASCEKDQQTLDFPPYRDGKTEVLTKKLPNTPSNRLTLVVPHTVVNDYDRRALEDAITTLEAGQIIVSWDPDYKYFLDVNEDRRIDRQDLKSFDSLAVNALSTWYAAVVISIIRWWPNSGKSTCRAFWDIVIQGN